jgi:hypothetical protein
MGIHHADHVAPSNHKSWHYAYKRWSLGRYSSLTDSDHGVNEVKVVELVGPVACIGGMRNASKVLVGTFEGKTACGGSRQSWEYYIEMTSGTRPRVVVALSGD